MDIILQHYELYDNFNVKLFAKGGQFQYYHHLHSVKKKNSLYKMEVNKRGSGVVEGERGAMLPLR